MSAMMNIEKCPKCGWRHSAEECPPQAPTGQQAEPAQHALEDAAARAVFNYRVAHGPAGLIAALAGQQAERPAPAGTIPVEASIAWQAGAFDPLHPKNAVTVEGRSWYRDDHPQVARPAPAGQALHDALDALEQACNDREKAHHTVMPVASWRAHLEQLRSALSEPTREQLYRRIVEGDTAFYEPVEQIKP